MDRAYSSDFGHLRRKWRPLIIEVRYCWSWLWNVITEHLSPWSSTSAHSFSSLSLADCCRIHRCPQSHIARAFLGRHAALFDWEQQGPFCLHTLSAYSFSTANWPCSLKDCEPIKKNCSCPQRFFRSQDFRLYVVSATPWSSSSCLFVLAGARSLLFVNCSNVAIIRSASPVSCRARSRGSSCVWTNLQHSLALRSHCKGCLLEALLHVTHCPC